MLSRSGCGDFRTGIGEETGDEFVGSVGVLEGGEPHGGAAVAGEVVEIGATPRVRRDGEGTNRRKRIGEQAAGKFGVREGRGFLLDRPVASKIGAVLDQKRNEFLVEIVAVGESGEDGGQTGGGECLDMIR